MSNAVVTQAELDAKFDELERAGWGDKDECDYAAVNAAWEKYLASRECFGRQRYMEEWTMGGVWSLIDWLSGLVEWGSPVVVLRNSNPHQSSDPEVLAFRRPGLDAGLTQRVKNATITRLRLANNCTTPAEACRVAIETVGYTLDGDMPEVEPDVPAASDEAVDDLNFDFSTSGGPPPPPRKYDDTGRYADTPVTSVWVIGYHHIDSPKLIPPLATMPDKFHCLSPCPPDMAAGVFRAAGWEGDGELGYIYLPPFVFDSGDTFGCVVYHVKQHNNGTSFILARSPLSLPMTQPIGIFEWEEFPLPRDVAGWAPSP